MQLWHQHHFFWGGAKGARKSFLGGGVKKHMQKFDILPVLGHTNLIVCLKAAARVSLNMRINIAKLLKFEFFSKYFFFYFSISSNKTPSKITNRLQMLDCWHNNKLTVLYTSKYQWMENEW